jgi:hypothetical protein
MNLFRFLKRPVRAALPQPIPPGEVARDSSTPIPALSPGPASDIPATPSPPAPTPDAIRRLLFDAVASGDEARLQALCEEHQDLIVQHSAAWLEVPAEFRASPELDAWYRNGLRAISEYCAERAAKNELTEGIRQVLDGPRREPGGEPESIADVDR